MTTNTPTTPDEWRAEQERVLKEVKQLVNLYGECLHQYQTHHLEDGNSVNTWYVCQLCEEETYFPKPYEQVRLGIELVTQYRAYAEACGQIAALLAAHAEMLERERWIPVEERLPAVLHTVLFYSPATYWRGCHNFGYLLPNGEWHAQGFQQPLTPNSVTHWQTLPAPPAPASAKGQP